MRMTLTGRLTYEVTSRRDEPPYHVDVGSGLYAGICNGKCDCPHFKRIRNGTIKELMAVGKFVPNDETRCAHIRFVLEQLAKEWRDEIVVKIRKQNNDYDADEF